MDIVHI